MNALYRVNLGQTLWKMGRKAEATAQFQMAKDQHNVPPLAVVASPRSC